MPDPKHVQYPQWECAHCHQDIGDGSVPHTCPQTPKLPLRPGLDQDLVGLDREALIAEVKKLRAGIRADRDATGHNLCWYRPELWGLLPERPQGGPSVPPWPEFMSKCAEFRASLEDLPLKPSRRDQERLRLGAWALALPGADNREQAEALGTELSRAIAAMQSLDDLGTPEANEKAEKDLAALQERYRQVIQSLEMP